MQYRLGRWRYIYINDQSISILAPPGKEKINSYYIQYINIYEKVL